MEKNLEKNKNKNKNIYNRTFYPWLVLLLAAGFFFAEYFARVAPSVMVPDLMAAFKVNALALGSLSAFFYYAYVAMQLPVGALMDRFGPRVLLSSMACVCGLACLIFAHTNSLHMAALSRFLMGFSAAFAFVGALKIARTWFCSSRFGFLAGLTQALGMVGAAVGEGPVSVLVENLGWRPTMLIIGAILIILSILIFIFVRDRKYIENKKIHIPNKDNSDHISIITSLVLVLKNKQTWINGLIVGCLYAPTAAFAELWGASYLNKVYGFKPEIAASGVGLIFIGWAISSPIIGFISDKIGQRKPVIICSLLLSALFMLLVLYLPNLSTWGLFILLFCYGLSNVGVATCYAVASEIVDVKCAGTSMSFANMASVIIGAFFQPIIGGLLDYYAKDGGKHIVNASGVIQYSAHDYRMSMALLPICFFVGLVGCVFLKERI